ncbi:MAG: nickel-dependent hydrogenase large subunit [Bacteriovoracaceae bacterium]|nr:nickel-dependent hydrogenase large subunit [Bacteriovoracaceae bacterium]
MSERKIVPFGPQHPVLPEPIHLKLVVEDEKVVEAVPYIGYIHRGLEKLVEKKDFMECVMVAERICGICSFIHGQGYSQVVEEIMGIEVPPRGRYLRTIWAELSRLHSHLLWFGLFADAFGFESLFMHCWRLREKILGLIEMTTGGRVIFGVCRPGGVKKDISPENLQKIVTTLEGMQGELEEIIGTFMSDTTVKARLCGVGVVSKEDMVALGGVGPTMRASGIASDLRQLGYAAYKDLNFKPVFATEGDAYARAKVRLLEIFQSIDLINQAIKQIPGGPTEVKVTGMPNGEYFGRLEQPRGEVIYYLKANGTKFLQRMRVRTPTFANLAVLLKTLPGAELADVPILVLAIDPCVSCTER